MGFINLSGASVTGGKRGLDFRAQKPVIFFLFFFFVSNLFTWRNAVPFPVFIFSRLSRKNFGGDPPSLAGPLRHFICRQTY